MIQLLQLEESDIDIILDWHLSERDLCQFAGPIFQFPLTYSQFDTYLKLPNQKVCKVVDESMTLVGLCEFNFNYSIPRLSRIIIGEKSSRGKGMGKLIIQKMLHILFEDPTINKVDLNVFDWNLGAIKCYQKVGFKISESTTKPYIFQDKQWMRLNMTVTRETFIQ